MPHRAVPHLFALVAASLFPAGCGPPPEATPARPTVVRTSLDDVGRLVSPTTTIRIEFSAPPDAETLPAGVVVVYGAPDDDLVRDLGREPRPDSVFARLAPVRVNATAGAATVQVTPSRPLPPETLHTLLVTDAVRVGGQRIARAAPRPFITAGESTAAATWSLRSPENGDGDVVRNLRRVEVRFSRLVTFVDEDSLRLLDDQDQTTPAHVAPGERPEDFVLEPLDALAPLQHYRVVASDTIRDEAGDPPFALDPAPGFTTGTTLRTLPPSIDGLELVASSGCLAARFTTDVPAVARLCVDDHCGAETTPRALHELSAPLAAGASAGVVVSARDLSSAPEAARGPLPAPASSPRTITITEVLARPRGAHLAQQFVEVMNRGGAPVDLGGLELHDDAGFDVLPAATLAPGGYALIVTADWQADDGLDPPAGAEAVIVRVAGGSLGRNGIRESGETIALTEPDGRPASLFSTDGLDLAEGQSARRVGACDVAASYRPTPGGTSTPGGP